MEAGLGTARISIHFNVEQPIELMELTLSFQAIARRYRKYLIERAKNQGIRPADTSVKLYVTKIESNCIFAELGGATEILGALFSVMNYTNIFVDFVKNTGIIIEFYRNIGRSGQIEPENVTESKRDIEAISDFLKVASDNANGRLSFAAINYQGSEKDGKKDVLLQVTMSSEEAAEARRGALLAIASLDQKTDADYKNVLMFLHQTSLDDPKADGQTVDKALIRTISQKPLKVFFASQLDQDRMASFKNDPSHNPFKASYRVDVNVERDRNDIPRFYRVVHLHEIIPDDDES